MERPRDHAPLRQCKAGTVDTQSRGGSHCAARWSRRPFCLPWPDCGIGRPRPRALRRGFEMYSRPSPTPVMTRLLERVRKLKSASVSELRVRCAQLAHARLERIGLSAESRLPSDAAFARL